MNKDEILYSLRNVFSRKLRSGLTVLSILIGIAAIYALVSFGAGMQNYIDTLASESGTDKMFVQAKGVGAPGTDENFYLTKDDVDFIQKVNGVSDVIGLYMKTAEVRKDNQVKYFFASGYDPEDSDFVEETFTVEVEKGRQLKGGDDDKVVLGGNYQYAKEIFSNPVVLGEKIEINGMKFQVIGFYEAVGNPQDDSNIYLTYEGFESLYPSAKDKFGFLMVESSKTANPEEVADRITKELRDHKGQEEGKENFFVQTFADALKTFTNIIIIINGILFLIALISLIVAGVNTMNTMYTAVLERTKEIGIMKAIGARNSDILIIFVFESGFLGMMGGIIGVLIGFGIASAGGAIAAAAGFSALSPVFPLWLTIGCILFSFGVGAVSGILPAVQASRLKPVDALRYE